MPARLQRSWVDDKQQIALLDDLAFLEMMRLQIAADAGAQLDIFERRELAGVLGVLDHFPLQRLRDGHWRRRLRDDTAGGHQRRQYGQCPHYDPPHRLSWMSAGISL